MLPPVPRYDGLSSSPSPSTRIRYRVRPNEDHTCCDHSRPILRRRHSHNYHSRRIASFTSTLCGRLLVFLVLPVIYSWSSTTTSIPGVDAVPLDPPQLWNDNNAAVAEENVDGSPSNIVVTKQQSLLRGDASSTAKRHPTNDMDFHDEDHDQDDKDRYILDYDQIDAQHRRKLVTILDRPQQQQRQTTLFGLRNVETVTWIVRVKNDESTTVISSQISSLRILSRLKTVFNGLVVKGITASTLQWLLARSDVLLIEEDQPVYAAQLPTRPANTTVTLTNGEPWGVDLVDGKFDRKYSYTYSGVGVTVFILDTGIMSAHEEFGKGRVTCGANLILTETCEDLKGHGTHVAATVGGKTYGVARSVSLVNVKVLDKSGGGVVSSVVIGLEYVAIQKLLSNSTPMIAGLSLGSNFSSVFNAAVTKIVDLGIVAVVVSGNEQVDACTTSPGSTEKAITVGAIDSALTRPSWSNYGDCVDIYAPGVSVLSATYDAKDKKKTSLRSGTSVAVPHVVGVVAMYLQWNPKLTPSQINDFLVSDSTAGILSNLLPDGDDDDDEDNNLLISNAKIQNFKPITLAPTLAPTRLTASPSAAPSRTGGTEEAKCGAIFTPCLSDDDCCTACLSINLFNLGLWGQRCFFFG